ncbi:TPA: N-acetylmuramoyl-L-alanine amidase [Streptococcus suis]|nr:N-acetylmuramoyl-L-alanine amidase [Streptococcus suis]HEL9645034.1 N-acetylmuramoyl-L-alanine amidase [Streptococcus suis]HEL9645859.1 N-acetylmuramoyl-L-alanine amidase [Streptococcus suis]HEM2680623.1 N-acetylmuramoyl-L-alanine amidase [Streptococcus suis]HEM6179020.1 N-acetylmuramoyl-L-alanine amidase [Streptococcus suis]
MSNSPLVNHINLSPNHSGLRNHKIDTITIHHMAGNLSVETCGKVFEPRSRQASSNYGVDSKGRVGMYVEEKNRSWCSSNPANDNRAITIEVANDQIGGNWHVSDIALEKTIDLCVDICQRNGIKALNYTGDTRGNLTKHEWFANTNCPGPYLGSKFPYIAAEVNKRLGGQSSTPIQTSTKNLDDVARQVINGRFGNGEERKQKLRSAGYDPVQVQNRVNALLGKKPTPQSSLKFIDEVAQEVLNGKWGNGNQRKSALIGSGYDYDKVQAKVNEIVSGKFTPSLKPIEVVAREVINGKWGNGQDRKNRLTQAGYDYYKVQQKVNQLL